MKILAQKMEPTKGNMKLGSSVDMEYFAQYDFDDLHQDNTVLGEFLSKAPLNVSNNARGILGAFLFQNDDVEKKINVLSGGERTRLRLARMLCGSANLLMLDEPTNHLDIGSRLTLENALKQYEGAVVLVSHDAYFLNNVATRVVEIRDGKAFSYPGNYEDFMAIRTRQLEQNGSVNGVSVHKPVEKKKVEKEQPKAKPIEEKQELSKEEKRDLNNLRNDLMKEIKKLEKSVEEAEENVMESDAEVREFENELAHPDNASNADSLQSLTSDLKDAQSKLSIQEENWTKLQSELDEKKESLNEILVKLEQA